MPEDPTPETSGERRVRGKRNSYAKISLKTRLIFFRKVVEEGGDMRKVLHTSCRLPADSRSTSRLLRPSYVTIGPPLSSINA